MDALKKAEAANKERTPPEIVITDSESESLKFFTRDSNRPETVVSPPPETAHEDTLDLIDWETEPESPASEDSVNFDWLNAEIALPDDADPQALAHVEAAPTRAASEETEFFIDEPTPDEASDEFVLDNFELEDPASTPGFREDLIATALQQDAAETYDFTPTLSKPVNSMEFTPPANKENVSDAPKVTHPQPNPEPPNPANQEAAQRIFDARQQKAFSYRTALYSLLVLVLLGIIGIYAYSFLFSNTPTVGLTRYPVNNTANVAQNTTPPTPPNNPNISINNTPASPAPPTTPINAPPANNVSSFQPIVPMFPPMNSTDKIEKNGVSLPNGANEPVKTSKHLQKNASNAPEKAAAPLQGTEQLTGMLSLKKDSLTHASQDLNTAYQALQQGNLSHSERAYKKVLQYDGRNRDALLGLAAIALQQGRIAQAQHYYQQILQSYPQDSLAQAGLISSLGERSPDASVSQLKTMLAQLSQKAENLPQVAYLQFTLGNVYARQQAWTEAQQAYFEAFRTEPRADYAYNLAISLDQLHQYTAAANYYQQALQLGQGREQSGFDRQAATQRLQELNPSRGVQAVSPAE